MYPTLPVPWRNRAGFLNSCALRSVVASRTEVSGYQGINGEMCVCHGSGNHSDVETAKTRVGDLSRRGFMVALAGFSGTALAGCVGAGQTGLGLGLVSSEEAQ